MRGRICFLGDLPEVRSPLSLEFGSSHSSDCGISSTSRTATTSEDLFYDNFVGTIVLNIGAHNVPTDHSKTRAARRTVTLAIVTLGRSCLRLRAIHGRRTSKDNHGPHLSSEKALKTLNPKTLHPQTLYTLEAPEPKIALGFQVRYPRSYPYGFGGSRFIFF